MTLRMSMAEAKKLGLKIAAATPAGGASSLVTFGQGRRGAMPDDVLWQAVSLAYPEAAREFKGAIPGRRFRIDVALPEVKIAIEVDGWQYHGKFKSAHQNDRERQNLFAIHGWLILRFTPGQIFKDIFGVMETIAAACRQRRVA